MFQVLFNGRNADCFHYEHATEKFKVSKFATFDSANRYAKEWCKHFRDVDIDIRSENVIHEVTDKDTIEIREVKE